MRLEVYKLDAKSSVATGTAFPVAHLQGKTIQLAENTDQAISATVVIEATVDGVHWFAVESLVNAPNIVKLDLSVISIRLNTTVWASGVLVATIAGFQSHAS